MIQSFVNLDPLTRAGSLRRQLQNQPTRMGRLYKGFGTRLERMLWHMLKQEPTTRGNTKMEILRPQELESLVTTKSETS